MRSMLVLPLVANSETLGCLVFAKATENYYDQDDMQLAYLLSTLLATAMQNSKRFEAETRRAQQLQMLSEIGQTATSILDPEALISSVPALVRACFDYDVAKIGMLSGDKVTYSSHAQAVSGLLQIVDTELPVVVDGAAVGIVGLATYKGETVLVPDVFEDMRWADVAGSLTGPHIRSALIIPMSARDKVLGVLHFESAKVNGFDASDVSILQSLANQLGVALDNARLYQQMNELFHGYLAPQVAFTLLNDPSNARLGGQRREVTVLFADLNGFTGLSEKLAPEALLELLNACLSEATEAVLEYGGTLDKYMGDAVMALFNAPETQPDHAWRAMRAAVSIQRRLQKLTAGWQHKLIFSVGINSGEAVVGNIGSSSLRNFTAIGDTVNLAKRIQEAAAPGQVLVSQETYAMALRTAPDKASVEGEDNVTIYRVGTEPIRGRTRPAVIYEVSPYTSPLARRPTL